MDKKELIELIDLIVEKKITKPENPMGQLESDSLDKLAPALSKMQGEFTPVKPTKINPQFNSKYADYDDIMDMARPHLAKNGFSLHCKEENFNGKRYLRMKLLHNSQQYISSFVEVIENNNNRNAIQGYGGALSYHKRYSAQNLLNITVKEDILDNDGEPIQINNNKQPQKQTVKKEYIQTNTDAQKKEKPVTWFQCNRIENLLEKHNDIKKLILEAYKKNLIKDLPENKFEEIVNIIEKAIKKKKG